MTAATGLVAQLLVDQRSLPDGTFESTWLRADEGRLMLQLAEVEGEIPLAVLEVVMRRYAKPLADDVAILGERLELGQGRSLVLLRHLAKYDVIAKDYLVYLSPPDPPLAELAISIAAALTFLVRGGKKWTEGR